MRRVKLSDAISFIDSTRIAATNRGKVILEIKISVMKAMPRQEDMSHGLYTNAGKKNFAINSPFKCARTIRTLTKVF